MIRFCALPLFALLVFVSCGIGQEVSGESDTGFDPCYSIEGGAVFKPINEIKTTLQTDGKRLPPDCSSQQFTSESNGAESRFYTDTEYHWLPTNFFHMPAYLDDVPLERYGQSRFPKLQPAISGAKFALQVPMLPYKMGVDRPHACITTLGHQPPGDCVPCIRQRLPKSARGALVQAAATTGLVFWLP